MHYSDPNYNNLILEPNEERWDIWEKDVAMWVPDIAFMFLTAIPVTQLTAANSSLPSWGHPLSRVQIQPAQWKNCMFLQDTAAVIRLWVCASGCPVEKRRQTLARKHGWSRDLMRATAGVLSQGWLLASTPWQDYPPPMGREGGWGRAVKRPPQLSMALWTMGRPWAAGSAQAWSMSSRWVM